MSGGKLNAPLDIEGRQRGQNSQRTPANEATKRSEPNLILFAQNLNKGRRN